MSSHSGNVGSMRSYLLGELSEQEREQVEQRLMTDDDLYQRLLLAEDDLIDEYVSGALSDQERAKFSRRFLRVPELQQDVKSVMALRKHALKTASQVASRDWPDPPSLSLFDWLRKFFMRPAVGVAFAAALLAAVALAVWLGTRNAQLRQQVEQLQARQPPALSPQPELSEQLAAERVLNERLSEELLRQQELLAEESRKLQQAQAQHRPTPTPKPDLRPRVPPVFAFTLGTGAVRESGGGVKEVSVPPGTRAVRIGLELAANDYRSYRAVLQIVGGREVLPGQGLRAGGGEFVQLNVPAKLLGPEDYEILLLGLSPSGEYEEVGRYYFRVLK